jgi:hypothetical protein
LSFQVSKCEFSHKSYKKSKWRLSLTLNDDIEVACKVNSSEQACIRGSFTNEKAPNSSSE